MNLNKQFKQINKHVLSSFIDASDSISQVKVGSSVLAWTQSPNSNGEFAEHCGRWVPAVVSEVLEQYENGGCLCRVLPKLKSGRMGSARIKSYQPGLPDIQNGPWFLGNSIKIIKQN